MGISDVSAKVERYRLRFRRHSKWATRVVFDDGCAVSFLEVVPKKMAIAQAKEARARDPAVCDRVRK